MSYRPARALRSQSPPKPEEQTKTASRGNARLLAVTLGGAAFLGFFLALPVLLPTVLVTPSDPPDAADPFSSSFTITNSNFIPLRHVDAYVGIRAPSSVSTSGRCVKFFVGAWNNHNLDMDERLTISLVDLFRLKPDPEPPKVNADIAVIVDFNPSFIPWRKTAIHRFIARQHTNGRYYWDSATIDPKLDCTDHTSH